MAAFRGNEVEDTFIDLDAPLIDLGDRIESPQTAPIRWREQVGRLRIGLLAGATVVVLALVVASAPPPIDPFPKSASLPIGSSAYLLVHGERALVIDTHGSHSEISSYALPGGHRVWTTRISGSAENSDAMVSGSTVVVQSPRSDGLAEVEGFDLATGQKRWNQAALGVLTGTPGLLVESPDGLQAGTRIDLLDPATGRSIWTLPVPDVCTVAVSATLIELCPAAQQMSSIDLRTGQVIARVGMHLPVHQGQRASLPQSPSLLFIGGVIVVSINDDPDLYAAGFRADGLAPLWSGLPITADVNIEACFPNVCAIDARGSVIQLDPGSGEVISQSSGVIISTGPVNNAPTTGGDDKSSSAIRPAAGITEIVVVPADQKPTVGAPALGVDFQQVQPEDVAVPLRDPTTVSAARMWVIRQVTTANGVTLHPIGLLRHVSDACLIVSVYLVCTTARDAVSLWRLP